MGTALPTRTFFFFFNLEQQLFSKTSHPDKTETAGQDRRAVKPEIAPVIIKLKFSKKVGFWGFLHVSTQLPISE